LTAEASAITFEAATAHSRALKAAAQKADEEDDEQSYSSDNEVSDEGYGAVNRVELPIQTL
jgi:hypothetical protein